MASKIFFTKKHEENNEKEEELIPQENYKKI
jgi:hypothetical protein